MTTLHPQDTFEDMAALRSKFKMWAMENRCPYIFSKGCSKRLRAICPSMANKKAALDGQGASCPFVMSARLQKDKKIHIVRAELEHSPFCQVKFRCSRMALQQKYEAYVAAFGTATPREIMNQLRQEHGVDSTYMTAWRAIKAVQRMHEGMETPRLEYDNHNSSLQVVKRRGRPRKPGMRTRGELVGERLFCGKCGQRGHNIRTCDRRQVPALPHIGGVPYALEARLTRPSQPATVVDIPISFQKVFRFWPGSVHVECHQSPTMEELDTPLHEASLQHADVGIENMNMHSDNISPEANVSVDVVRVSEQAEQSLLAGNRRRRTVRCSACGRNHYKKTACGAGNMPSIASPGGLRLDNEMLDHVGMDNMQMGSVGVDSMGIGNVLLDNVTLGSVTLDGMGLDAVAFHNMGPENLVSTQNAHVTMGSMEAQTEANQLALMRRRRTVRCPICGGAHYKKTACHA